MDKQFETEGYALAMAVLQSDLYRKLDDIQRAECDEFIRRGMQKPVSENAAQEDGLVSITHNGSTHVRKASQWLALARADLAALSAERGGEQKPVGYLDWPALTFRFNGTAERIGPMPVNAEPIPLYTRPQAGPVSENAAQETVAGYPSPAAVPACPDVGLELTEECFYTLWNAVLDIQKEERPNNRDLLNNRIVNDDIEFVQYLFRQGIVLALRGGKHG